jgi:hypothetical protein
LVNRTEDTWDMHSRESRYHDRPARGMHAFELVHAGAGGLTLHNELGVRRKGPHLTANERNTHPRRTTEPCRSAIVIGV